MEVFLAGKKFLLISVSKNLLDNENKITASFNTNYQQNQFELSNDERSLYKFKYNEENNENLVFIFALNENYELKLDFNSKEKVFNINANDFRSNDFWEMKIENKDFFNENAEQPFKVCEDTELIEEAKKCLESQANEQINQTVISTIQSVDSPEIQNLLSQMQEASERGDQQETLRLNMEMVSRMSNMVTGQNNFISNERIQQSMRMLNLMQNSTEYQDLQAQAVKANTPKEMLRITKKMNKIIAEGFKPKKCNKKLWGFGIATGVAFLITLFFGVATFGFGLFPMLLGGILFGVSAGATIGFGVPFTIFIKNERENEKTSQLGQEVLLPNSDNFCNPTKTKNPEPKVTKSETLVKSNV